MQSNFYVGLSAQISLQRRLETIANNVANASTAGFPAEEVKFESVLSRLNPDPVSYASAGKPYLSRKSGEIVRTDNRFDVAVQGDAGLGIQTPSGTVYTRDGRMRMTETGELTRLNNQPVLDAGGSGVRLERNGRDPPRSAAAH